MTICSHNENNWTLLCHAIKLDPPPPYVNRSQRAWRLYVGGMVSIHTSGFRGNGLGYGNNCSHIENNWGIGGVDMNVLIAACGGRVQCWEGYKTILRY